MAFIDRFGNRQTGTGGFVDYYLPQPKLPDDDIPPEEEVPVVEEPVSPNLLVPQQQDDGGLSQEEESDMRFNLDGVDAGMANFSEIKHKSYEDYLKTTNYQLDRSGVFSQTQFTPEGVDSEGKKTGKRFGTVEAMFGLVPYGGAIVSQFDTRAVKSPLGQERFAQTFGIGNIATTQNLIDEYDALNQIKNDRLEVTALNAPYKDRGYAFTIGNLTAYRTKGSTTYKGLPQGMSQNVAKSIEALQNGMNPSTYDPASGKFEPVVTSITEDGKLKGGYTLDGSFVMVSGQTAKMGMMDDFVNMARSGFKSGNLTQKEAQSFARGWLDSARSMSSKATMAEKLANLKSWQNRAKAAGKMTAAQKAKNKVNNWAKSYTTEAKDPNDYRSAGPTGSAADIAAQEAYEQELSESGADYSGYGDGSVADAYDDPMMNEGGQVGMAEGDQVAPEIGAAPEDDGDMILSANELMEGEPESGFIRKPASQTTDAEGVTDDNPTLAPNEENPRGAAIVINKQAVDQAGEKNLIKQIQEAREYLRAKGGDSSAGRETNTEEGMSEIITADGEILIQPEEADVIGRKRLLALNERGKKATREVKKKVQTGQPESSIKANEGGFITKYGVDVLEPMNANTKKVIQSLISRGNITRGSVEKAIDSLPDREALAMMIFAESYASTDSQDAMRGIGETALNRVKDKTYSFRNQNTLKDVLKGRSNKGSGSKMFSYEGLEPKYLRPRLKEMLNNKYWQRALDAADNALETEPDMERYKLRDDVFTYARVGEASDRLRSNKRNEYFTTIGQHDFYSRTPEKGGRISIETMGQPSSFYR